MRLTVELRKAGIEWCVDLIHVPQPSTRYPGVTHQVPKLRVRLANVAEAQAAGTEAVTHELLLTYFDGDLQIEQVLAKALREHFPRHPLFRAWLDSHGNVETVLTPGGLENLGELIHTALRKMCDGPQSTILWNTQHHLLHADWSHFLDLIREEITKLVSRVDAAKQAGRKARLLRRDVGMAIKRAMIERFDEVHGRGFEKNHKLPKRTDVQEYALRTWNAACRLTEDSEWTYGWTGYLCEDAPEPETQEPNDQVEAAPA